MFGNFKAAAQLAASEEGLSSMESVLLWTEVGRVTGLK
jgi:hypothetical protein